MCIDLGEQLQGGAQVSTLETECRQVAFAHPPKVEPHMSHHVSASPKWNLEDTANLRRKEPPQKADTLSEENAVSVADPKKQLQSSNSTTPEPHSAEGQKKGYTNKRKKKGPRVVHREVCIATINVNNAKKMRSADSSKKTT